MLIPARIIVLFYPALTGSNLSISKMKRQVQDFHLKIHEGKEVKWEINCP